MSLQTVPDASVPGSAPQAAEFIRSQLPPGGLFADQSWRISPAPFTLGAEIAKEVETLGRICLQFYRAVNLLYRQSVAGKQPAWVAALLDQGKPADLIEWQRHSAFKSDVPRVIRPDLLLTENGLAVTELDSVPGGIGATAWLNQTYANAEGGKRKAEIIGGPDGMLRGFEGIFGDAKQVHLVVSEEAAGYRPEMEWLARQMRSAECGVRNSQTSPRATRCIASLNCLIWRTWRTRNKFLHWRRKRKSA